MNETKYKLVPVVPTEAMIDAAMNAGVHINILPRGWAVAYRAMIAAAPASPALGEEELARSVSPEVTSEMARIKALFAPRDGKDGEDLITYAKEVVRVRASTDKVRELEAALAEARKVLAFYSIRDRGGRALDWLSRQKQMTAREMFHIPKPKLDRIESDAHWAGTRRTYDSPALNGFRYDHGNLLTVDTKGNVDLLFDNNGDRSKYARILQHASPAIMLELVRGYRLAIDAGLMTKNIANAVSMEQSK